MTETSAEAAAAFVDAVQDEVLALGLAADPHGEAAMREARDIQELLSWRRGDTVHALRQLDGTLRRLQLVVPGLTERMRDAIQLRCDATRRLTDSLRAGAHR